MRGARVHLVDPDRHPGVGARSRASGSQPSAFLSVRRRYLALIVIALAGVVAFAATFIDFASVFSLNGGLSATGAGFTGFVNLWWCIPIAAGVVALLALGVRGRSNMPTTSGIVALLIAGAATSAMLGYIASGDGECSAATTRRSSPGFCSRPCGDHPVVPDRHLRRPCEALAHRRVCDSRPVRGHYRSTGQLARSASTTTNRSDRRRLRSPRR